MTPTQEDMAYAKSIVEAVEQAEPLYEDKCLAVRDWLMRHRLAAEERGARMALEAAAKVAGAMSHNVNLPTMIERYGEEACDHAANHLEYCETAIRQIDPAALKGAE